MQALKTCFFFCLLWAAEKGKKFKFQWNLTFKMGFFFIGYFSLIWWATLLNNSYYEQHGTYVSRFTFLLHQESPKKHFCHGDGTHFLVLA